MLIYTNTRSKVKPKLKSKSERDEYAAWCKKHGIDPAGSRRRKTTTVSTLNSSPYIRETSKGKSLGSFVTGAVTVNGTKKEYTGDKMLGIAAMHKSNLVPVFSSENAVELSHMRR